MEVNGNGRKMGGEEGEGKGLTDGESFMKRSQFFCTFRVNFSLFVNFISGLFVTYTINTELFQLSTSALSKCATNIEKYLTKSLMQRRYYFNSTCF